MTNLKLLTQQSLIKALKEGGHTEEPPAPRTIHLWVAAGMPVIELPGTNRKFILESVLAWFKEQNQPVQNKQKRRNIA